MALTRSALREKGITDKEILDFIMEEHGNTLEAAKEKAKEAADLAAGKLQDKIDALQGQIDNAPKLDGEDWKAKLDALQAKYDTDIAAKGKELSDFKAAVESEKTAATKREAIRRQLAADGANQKLIGLLEKEFDIAAIELDGEKIKGWDELSKPVKESYADVFTVADVKGTPPAAPPAGGGGGTNYAALLEQARKDGNTQEAVRIKTEASKEGVILI